MAERNATRPPTIRAGGGRLTAWAVPVLLALAPAPAGAADSFERRLQTRAETPTLLAVDDTGADGTVSVARDEKRTVLVERVAHDGSSMSARRGRVAAGAVAAVRGPGRTIVVASVDRGLVSLERLLTDGSRDRRFGAAGTFQTRALRDGFASGTSPRLRAWRTGRLTVLAIGATVAAIDDRGRQRFVTHQSSEVLAVEARCGGGVLIASVVDGSDRPPLRLVALDTRGRPDRSFGENGRLVLPYRGGGLASTTSVDLRRVGCGHVVNASADSPSHGAQFSVHRVDARGKVLFAAGVGLNDPRSAVADAGTRALADARVVGVSDQEIRIAQPLRVGAQRRVVVASASAKGGFTPEFTASRDTETDGVIADISDEGLVMVARPQTLDSRAIVLGLSLDSELRVRRTAMTAPARDTFTP